MRQSLQSWVKDARSLAREKPHEVEALANGLSHLTGRLWHECFMAVSARPSKGMISLSTRLEWFRIARDEYKGESIRSCISSSLIIR